LNPLSSIAPKLHHSYIMLLRLAALNIPLDLESVISPHKFGLQDIKQKIPLAEVMRQYNMYIGYSRVGDWVIEMPPIVIDTMTETYSHSNKNLVFWKTFWNTRANLSDSEESSIYNKIGRRWIYFRLLTLTAVLGREEKTWEQILPFLSKSFVGDIVAKKLALGTVWPKIMKNKLPIDKTGLDQYFAGKAISIPVVDPSNWSFLLKHYMQNSTLYEANPGSRSVDIFTYFSTASSLHILYIAPHNLLTTQMIQSIAKQVKLSRVGNSKMTLLIIAFNLAKSVLLHPLAHKIFIHGRPIALRLSSTQNQDYKVNTFLVPAWMDIVVPIEEGIDMLLGSATQPLRNSNFNIELWMELVMDLIVHNKT